MKRAIFLFLATLFLSNIALADSESVSAPQGDGDSLNIQSYDTDDHFYRIPLQLFSGTVPYVNMLPSTRLNDVNLQNILDAKAGTSSLPTTFDQLSDGSTNKAFTSTLKAKLDGISAAATANDTDTNLKNRANHTGTQVSTTISDWTEASQDAVGGALGSDMVYNDAGNAISLRVRSFTNNPSAKTIQTVAASANGFQLSSTRDSQVSYSVTVTSLVQIGAATNVSGYVVLEVAATNSSTAGDWQEIARVGTGQNISLALALGSTQTVSGDLAGMVPIGYYARLRSVNTNGNPTYAYNSGQEVLL